MALAEDHVEPVDLHVGLRVRVRRRELGMSQQALAEACGVSFQQVQKYERGANRISCSMLVKIAAALDVSPCWFFEGIDHTGTGEMGEDTKAWDHCLQRVLHHHNGPRFVRQMGHLNDQQLTIMMLVAEQFSHGNSA